MQPELSPCAFIHLAIYFSLCMWNGEFLAVQSKSSEMCQHVTGSGRCPAIQADINGFLFFAFTQSPPTSAYIFPSTLPSFVLPLFSLYLFLRLAILGPTPLCVPLSDLSFLRSLTHTHVSLSPTTNTEWTSRVHGMKTNGSCPWHNMQVSVSFPFCTETKLAGGHSTHDRD